MSATLLCPISDFPFMLLGCVPVAAILTVSSLVPLAILITLGIQYQRRLQSRLVGTVQLRGVVTGFGSAGAVGLDDGGMFSLGCGDKQLLVSALGARIQVRSVTVGDRVRIVGIDGHVVHPGERLFRQPASQPGIEALQITRDRRRLWIPLALAVFLSWLGFVITLLVMTRY